MPPRLILATTVDFKFFKVNELEYNHDCIYVAN